MVIKGAVAIGENTTIRSGCYIEGPVAIGRDCDIGPNCYIRPATAIGDGCPIDFPRNLAKSVTVE